MQFFSKKWSTEKGIVTIHYQWDSINEAKELNPEKTYEYLTKSRDSSLLYDAKVKLSELYTKSNLNNIRVANKELVLSTLDFNDLELFSTFNIDFDTLNYSNSDDRPTKTILTTRVPVYRYIVESEKYGDMYLYIFGTTEV